MFKNGKFGEFYNIGSNKNLNNLEITNSLIKISKKIIKIGSNVKVQFVKKINKDVKISNINSIEDIKNDQF